MEDTISSAERNSGVGEKVRRKNRTSLEIVALMLGVAEQGVRKTQLMYGGNLSFELLHKYLERLMKADLIERQQERNQFIYKTTAKGLQFIKEYNDFQKYAAMHDSKKSVLEKFLSI